MLTSQSKIYYWTGTNSQGERVQGEQTANSSLLLKVELRRQGIIPHRIRKKSKPLFHTHKKITPKEITLFVRQMATLLTAGIPIVQAFELIARGQTNAVLQQLLLSIKADVEAGMSVSEVFRKHPSYFNTLLCNLIAAGENSGILDTMFKRVAGYREKTELLKSKVRKALLYPSSVIMVAIIVTAVLMIFVVPQFESLFKGFGAELPAMTQFAIQFSYFMQASWGWLLGFYLGIGIVFLQMKKRSEKFADKIDSLLLRLPILGSILTKAVIARFARTLSTTFAAGLPLIDALNSVSGATGNRIYAQQTLKIRDQLSTGKSLQTAMKTTQLFPAMVLQMVAIGEESGTLDSMLNKIADFYEEEVDTSVENLSSLLEPAILVILGVLVGGLVIAMYLPIFKLGGVV